MIASIEKPLSITSLLLSNFSLLLVYISLVHKHHTPSVLSLLQPSFFPDKLGSCHNLSCSHILEWDLMGPVDVWLLHVCPQIFSQASWAQTWYSPRHLLWYDFLWNVIPLEVFLCVLGLGDVFYHDQDTWSQFLKEIVELIIETAILYTAFSIKTSYVSWKSLCDLQTAERIMKLLLLTQHTITLKHF